MCPGQRLDLSRPVPRLRTLHVCQLLVHRALRVAALPWEDSAHTLAFAKEFQPERAPLQHALQVLKQAPEHRTEQNLEHLRLELHGVEFIGMMEQHEPEKIVPMLRSSTLVQLPANTEVFDQGAQADGMYIVLSGALLVRRAAPSLHWKTIASTAGSSR